MSAEILALCNQKGGVGKTTTAFHLARAAVLTGRRVLLVDADPQGNLTAVTTGEPVADDQVGVADALSTHAPETLADVIVPAVWPGLGVAPTSGITLGAVRDELVIAGAGREARLRHALANVAGEYDLILIDCAPSLDQLTVNALTAARRAVVVTQAKLFSANGLAQLLETVATVRDHYNPALTIGGVIVNQHEAATISGRQWLEDLHAAGGEQHIPVLTPPIPKRVVISDALEAATGLDEWGTADAAGIGDLYARHLARIEEGGQQQ